MGGGGRVLVTTFGVIGLDGAINRQTIQAAINGANGRTLILPDGEVPVWVDSNGKGINLLSNTSIVGGTNSVLNFTTDAFKTQAFGGVVTEDQVRAITVDNSAAPINNLFLSNFTITTPLERWYNVDEELVSIPIAFYFNNTNVEADYDNAISANNYAFRNITIANFQRGSVSVRGRKIINASFLNSSFINIARAELQYPTESRYLYTDMVITGLATSTTSYNFAVADMIGVSVVLYNGVNVLYSIPYPKTTTNPAIGEISGNPLTAGLLNWTLGAGIEAQITSISVVGHRRTTDATGADSINGIGLDFSNAQDLVISNCIFTGCADQFSHYIYMTREVNNITINNNIFQGLGVTKINSGGGVHIRGAAYDNVNIVDNDFINTHQNINVSSVSNVTITGNNHEWDYDLAPNGNMVELNYGAVDTMLYDSNTSESTNTFQPYAWVIGGTLTAVDITLSNNTASNISSINCLGTNILVDGNVISSSMYDTNNTSVIVMAHDDVNDVLNISFTNNNIEFNGLNPQPKIEGFTGFTWTGNTINSINLFRLGDVLKLKNITVSGVINALRLNCSGSIVISNFTGIISYFSNTVYLDMFQNQDVTMANCTDTGVSQRPVTANEFIITGTGAKSMSAASAQNLAYIDARVFTNTSIYQVILTNASAFDVTLDDYTGSAHSRKNIDCGGSDVVIPSLGTFTVQLDKVNGRWTKL